MARCGWGWALKGAQVARDQAADHRRATTRLMARRSVLSVGPTTPTTGGCCRIRRPTAAIAAGVTA